MSDTTDTNATKKTLDPTESVRVLEPGAYQGENMTLRQHQDADMHWIGESLPMPSFAHMRANGAFSYVGESPFPARADHIHEDNAVWSFYDGGNGQPLNPGQTFLNTLRHTGGRNDLLSGQTFGMPISGVYLIYIKMQCDRASGGNFTNEIEIDGWFNNGSHRRVLTKISVFDIPTSFVVEAFDFSITYPGQTSANANYQFSVAFTDPSVWSVYTNFIVVHRIAGVTSA